MIADGELAAQLASGFYHFVPDYLVTQTDNTNSVFSVEALGDTNDDGLILR